MSLQIIKDGYGNNTGIFIPITDWDAITQKHQDLKDLLNIEPAAKIKLSQLAGSISKETGEAMRKEGDPASKKLTAKEKKIIKAVEKAVQEVKEHKEGKTNLKTIQQVLDEL